MPATTARTTHTPHNPHNPHNGSQAPVFGDEILPVLANVRNTIGELLASLPDLRRPRDLERAIGIDYRLSWRLFQVAQAVDPLAIGSHVPGTAAMRRFLDKAGKYGASAPVITAAREAAQEFDRLVSTYADNRRSFDAMVAAIAGEGGAKLDWEHKRALFQAATRLYGIQVRTHLTCAILNQGSKPDLLDCVSMRGQFAMRRLRPNAPLFVSRHKYSSDYGAVVSDFEREPLDPESMSEHGVSVLSDFCTRPLPETTTSKLATGDVQTDLVGGQVGMDSQVTCVLGDVARNLASPYSDGTLPRIRSNVGTRVPTEVLVQDVMIPADLYGPLDPKLFVFTDRSMLELAPGHEKAGLLPIQESVTHLGRGLGVMHTPDVPRYGEMLRFAFDGLGWDPERFEVYRCRVEYPAMHSIVSMQFYLPERT